MVTAGVGTGQWWMVASSGAVWMVAGRCSAGVWPRRAVPTGQYRYQYRVIAAECGGLGLGITAASSTAPRRYFNGLYQVP
jgi:hypothetical protein